MTWIKSFAALGLVLSMALTAAADPAPAPADNQSRLPIYKIITDIPDTAWSGLKTAFSRDAVPYWGLIVGSTAVLYHYDEDLLEGTQTTGRRWGLSNNVNYKSLKLGNTTVFSEPTDTAGWLYFMGDGTIPVVVSLGMMGTGYFGENNHLYNTSIEMVNGLLTGSIFDQIIKHMAGRESPSARSKPRGAWRPFAPLKQYSANTSKYDAMASGHIMTATVMFTVLEQEYGEYNAVWIPVEVAWLATLGFGMVNVGVHWASDYPLGIGMGYLFGRSAVRLHHPAASKTAEAAHWQFFPSIDPATAQTTLNARYDF